ncbi:MAG: toxin [Pseudomonadota bacterium]
MKAIFVELPPFERYRKDYLDDDAFRALQRDMLRSPQSGDLIIGTGGLRKLRFSDERRGKGKRGGTRIIYYWWNGGSQFWLFTLYSKDEMSDLTDDQRKLLAQMLKAELNARGQ